MAWNVNGMMLSMAEGDFGIKLPVTITGTTLGAGDSLLFTFKDAMNGNTIMTKNFDTIVSNSVDLELTEAESEIFTVGAYVYSLDWYQEGTFMCNIIPSAQFKVVDKA